MYIDLDFCRKQPPDKIYKTWSLQIKNLLAKLSQLVSYAHVLWQYIHNGLKLDKVKVVILFFCKKFIT